MSILEQRNCTLLHTSLRCTWHGVLLTSAYKRVYCAMGTGVLCNLFWCVKLLYSKDSRKILSQQHGEAIFSTSIFNYICSLYKNIKIDM